MIYFIQSGDNGHVKIGYTTNFESRLKHLQTGCPETLKILATIKGGEDIERQLHNRFRQYQYRNEWFEPHPELLDFINKIRDKQSAFKQNDITTEEDLLHFKLAYACRMTKEECPNFEANDKRYIRIAFYAFLGELSDVFYPDEKELILENDMDFIKSFFELHFKTYI